MKTLLGKKRTLIVRWLGLAFKWQSGSTFPLIFLLLCPLPMGWADGSVDTLSSEMVFVIDATHSNDKCVDFVRQVLGRVQRKAEQFNQQHGESFRIGIVVFRDEGEEFLCGLQCKLTSDFKKTNVALSSIECEGGGDDPDAVTAGLELALSASSGWTENSTKHVILVGSSGNNSVGPSIEEIIKLANPSATTAKRMARETTMIHAIAIHTGTPDEQFQADFEELAIGVALAGVLQLVNERSPKQFLRAVDEFAANLTDLLITLEKIKQL